MTGNRTTEFIDEPDAIRNEAMDDGLLMTDDRTTETNNATERTCDFCEPWFDPKPLVKTPKLIIRLVVKDDMYRYVQVLRKGLLGSWRESELVAIDRCPICGRDV